MEGEVQQTKKCNKVIGQVMGLAIRTEEGCSLLQKGVVFFVATLLLTLLLAGGVSYELIYGSSVGVQATADITGFHGLRKPLLLLTPFAVLFIMLFGGLLFFIRCIAVPLDTIGMATRRMLDGQLDQHAQVTVGNEIGQIGELINDLAINKQELLLYFWNHTQQNCKLIDQLEKRMHEHPDREVMGPLVKKFFTQMQQGNNDVKSMILLYDFFDLKLAREKMLINHQEK